MKKIALLLFLVSPLLAAPPGAVVTAHREATRVGMEVLERGGNGVDAAVAVGFALGVVHPTAGNIGGGGFMVIRFPDGRATTIDFREKGPSKSHERMFLDEAGKYRSEVHHQSHLAVGVPGTVAGFALAHEKYGSRTWGELVAPAVRLADEGFVVTPGLAKSLEETIGRFQKHPPTLAQFTKEGKPYRTGDLLVQKDLGKSLGRIREGGRAGFYEGETAELFIAEMERGGGWITQEDLREYSAVEREPVRGTFHGYEIISMPPPSSGGTALIEMLNVLEGYDLKGMGHNSPEYVHHLAEAMRIAFRDRARFLADPGYAEVPIARLTGKDYAQEVRGGIKNDAAGVSNPADVEQAYESEQTTHYSIVDAQGMAVAVTYTLEEEYGAAMIVPGAGFLMNNEMGDFNAGPGLTNAEGLIGTKPNLARSGQRMLSSMTPTILVKEGRPAAVLGSPGGRGIINTVLQLVLNRIVFEMTGEEAVRAKRLHHQWLPDEIKIEEGLLDEAGRKRLAEMGHRISERESQGRSHVILFDAERGEPNPVADPRDEDASGGRF